MILCDESNDDVIQLWGLNSLSLLAHEAFHTRIDNTLIQLTQVERNDDGMDYGP